MWAAWVKALFPSSQCKGKQSFVFVWRWTGCLSLLALEMPVAERCPAGWARALAVLQGLNCTADLSSCFHSKLSVDCG